jgi:hypothetical protein
MTTLLFFYNLDGSGIVQDIVQNLCKLWQSDYKLVLSILWQLAGEFDG